jgi:hypothetical protein
MLPGFYRDGQAGVQAGLQVSSLVQRHLALCGGGTENRLQAQTFFLFFAAFHTGQTPLKKRDSLV